MALPPEGEEAMKSGSGGSAAPKAAKAEEPASGGPEAGPASGGPQEAGPASGGPEEAGPASGGQTGTKKSLLDYALHYLDSDVLYYAHVSEAEAQKHQEQYSCEPLVVQKVVVVQNGSYGWTAAQRGWKPMPGDPVKIELLFKGGANDLRQINRPEPGGGCGITPLKIHFIDHRCNQIYFKFDLFGLFCPGTINLINSMGSGMNFHVFWYRK